MSPNNHSHAESSTDIRLHEAQTLLQNRVGTISQTETIPIEEADRRVLAEDITASRNVPHYRRAAMDGYAVRANDTYAASETSPVILERTTAAVSEGTTSYVATGSKLPDGADSVARVEKVEETTDEIRVLEPISEGKDVAPIGEDVRAGQELYQSGHRIHPPDIGVLKSIGIKEITVLKQPTVGILPTGEEVVDSDPAPGEVVETNGLMLSKYVTRWGGSPFLQKIVTDDREVLLASIRELLSNDIVVTIGGSSVGRRDLLPEVVDELGELYVHHVSIKPGHPVGLGEIDGTQVVMLPGYPVSSVLNAVQFVRPAQYWMQGCSPPDFPSQPIPLAEAIESDPGICRFERIRVETDDRGQVAKPMEQSGAGALTSVSLADGWVVVEEEKETVPAGTTVCVEDWNTSV
jgi:molybdopterin molybdotransferase